MAPNTVNTDTSMLQDPKFVDFLAEQESNTVVYDPRVAARIAKAIQECVGNAENTPWLEAFVPYVAVKSIGHPHTLRAIFGAGFKADVATVQEARLALWAGRRQPGLRALWAGRRRLITPADVSFTNLWVGEEDIHELVKLGVRRFTVDKKNTVSWIAEAARAQGVDPGALHITLRVLLENTPDQGEKFGTPPNSAREIAVHARELGLEVVGIAFHIGTLNSAIYMDPEKHGLSRPVPQHELFDNYARILRDAAAPIRNELVAEGLIGPVVNTEGGLRPPYAFPEYDYRDVLRSQMEVFENDFTSPVRWIIEPGRMFDPSAVGKFTVQNVDMEPRAGEYPFAATEMALYTGAHDLQWGPRLGVRQSDVLAGRIYTPTSHPDEFARYQLVGSACAGSDQVGIREGFKYVPLPKGLRPGEVLLFLPFGAYTAAAIGPQTGQMMRGRHRPEDRYYGFNNVQWPNVVTYKRGRLSRLLGRRSR